MICPDEFKISISRSELSSDTVVCVCEGSA